MDKGIRPAALAKFLEQNELRRTGSAPYTGPKANTLFRKTVLFYIMENFGTSVASAATAYNVAFQTVRGTNPELVVGLGREEDKKGGRKRAVAVAVAAVAPAVDDAASVGCVLDSLILGGGGDEVEAAALTVAEVVQGDDPDLTPDLGAQQTLFTVKKKSDGTVIAEGISFDTARQLVARAASAKKAKLYWV
jgi:hypothetical protein